MRHIHMRAVVMIALSMPLGACNSFLGIHFARHAPKTVPAAAASPAVELAATDAETTAGRQQLADGQIGLALESFQRALAKGEPPAPAINGLGVAYARLGRYDLARRYFEEAAASDPADPRYSDNLTRLMRSPTFAMRHESDIAAVAVKADQIAAIAANPAGSPNPQPAVGQLQRVSRGEVRIATIAPQSAPVGSRQVQVDARYRPSVRLSLADASRVRPQSFVRITLPQARPINSGAVAADSKTNAAGGQR